MDKDSYPSGVHGIVRAPSSKSYAQRAIAAALLTEGETTILDMGLCSDTAMALEMACALGASYTREGNDYHIKGGLSDGALNPRQNILHAGESGLSARMFTPIAALCNVPVTVEGAGSLLRRPFGMMTAPLESLGVTIRSDEGRLPITVSGPIRGGMADVDGAVSSQFLTGLLMALPLAQSGTTLMVSNPVSTPYIDMTLHLLDRFGIEADHGDYTEFYIEGSQRYQAGLSFAVEGDWSGASCLLVAGAIAGEVTVENLDPLSLQADAAIINALSHAGAEIITTPHSVTVRRKELAAFDFDATHCPDLFPALAALAANCDGVSEIKGVNRLVAKESDRAKALVSEFGKMGINIEALPEDDIMLVHGGQARSATVDSHGDHRIAMAAAVAGLCAGGKVTVQGAEAVEKSYPAFWDDLFSLTKP